MTKCSAYPPTHGDKSARGPQPKTFSKSFCLLLRSVLKLKLIPKKHHILRHIFCLHSRDKIKLDLIGNQTVFIRYERRFSKILQFQLINKTSGPHPKRGRQQQGAWLTGWWPGSGSHVATTSCVSTWTQDSKIRSEAPFSHFGITWFPCAMHPARAVPRRHKTQRWGQNLRTHFKVTFTIGNGIPPSSF